MFNIPFFKSRRTRGDRAEQVMDARIPDVKERTWIETNLRIPITQFVNMTDYLEVGCKRVWASFRACHVTASILLTTQFKVVGKKNGAEVDNPELSQFLNRPNPYDSFEEMLYQWVYHMKLTGSAFWFKDQMNSAGRPKYVYPLLPQYVGIVPDSKTKIAYYVYRVNGREIKFDPEEIIYFRRPHPMSFIRGLGDIEPAERIFRDNIMKGELEKKFLANGAQPSSVLSKKIEVNDENEWKKIKAWWETNYAGTANAGKTAFLNGEWNYIKLGLTMQEMQSIESERWDIHQIFANHGVPLSIAGIDKATNYATAKQDEINFRRYEIVPLLDILCGKLNVGAGLEAELIGTFSPVWELTYELTGLVDVEATVREYGPLVDRGAMTLNQLREVCGMERDDTNPMLDQYMVNAGRIPIELAGMATPTPQEMVPPGEGQIPGAPGPEKPPKPLEPGTGEVGPGGT